MYRIPARCATPDGPHAFGVDPVDQGLRPTPDRARCRASCTRPASRASRLRLDWTTKVAFTATPSKINTADRTMITAAVTRSRRDTVFSGGSFTPMSPSK